jgi:hypothetical protein
MRGKMRLSLFGSTDWNLKAEAKKIGEARNKPCDQGSGAGKTAEAQQSGDERNAEEDNSS